MPPKRRTTAKSAPAPSKAAPASAPNPPKPIVPLAKAAAPPPPPPPPPPPVETPSAKVRKEWLNFISTWYEPEKKKLADQIMKELDVKYKKTASRIQQAARQTEKENRLSEIAAQLSEPAHEEWEKRLAAAQLQVDDWTDITDQEQQFVLSVFVGLFGDDEEEEEEDEDSATLNSNDIEDVTSEVDGFDFPTIRQSPPTPVTGNFELVNPSSFFADTVSPRNQSRKLPELAMDHLATLSNLNAGRNQPDPGTSTSAVFGFQGWASEAGLAVPTSASLPQPSGRHRATDNVSRQASGTSSASSPPLFSSGTGPYSPLQPMSKISPLTATQNLPPGKRYIGPVVADEEAEPIDEDLLKEKMSAEFLRFKMDIRIQMIQQFHDRASAIEIELVRQLDSDSSRESRLRSMQEHEQNMMSLRESKEIERKKLCDEERDRRLQEHRFLKQVAAQQAGQARWNASVSSSKAPLNKPTTQNGWTTQSAPKLAGQKENLSTGSLPTSALKPDPPSILKKSNSARPHDPIIPGFDEAAFLRSQAEAASLARGKQPPTTASNPFNRPSAPKKTESTSSQDEPVELVVPLSSATVQPPAVAKGKKGKRTPVITQQTKIVTFNEEPDIDAEPPPQPITPSTWSAKGAKVSLSSKPSKSVMIEEEPDEDADLTFSTWNAKNARATTPASAPTKKGKAVVVSEEVDADPSPPAPSTFGWGSAPSWDSAAATTKKKKAKAPIVPPEPAEDPFQTWGAKSGVWGSTSTKKTKAAVTEELDEEANPSPVVSGTAWNAGFKTASSSSKQSKKVPPQPEPRRNAQASKYAWVSTVQNDDEEEEEDEDEGEDEDEDEDRWNEIQTAPSMPGGMDATGKDESADAWGSSYWGSLAKGQPVAQAAEESMKHVRWTPTVDAGESGDEDSGIMDQNMESALWMQYAISGGDASGFEIDDQQELSPPSAAATKSNTNNSNTSIWEQGKGKGKKKSTSTNERSQIEATRVQEASASSGARTGQWQKTKMENWASRLGQSSGSARHL